MKAPISSANTGSRAEQVMSGATRIVTRRLRGEGMVRVAMMPGTAQAYEESRETKDRPSRPMRPIRRSITNAARAM
jgi:hypothetical protein